MDGLSRTKNEGMRKNSKRQNYRGRGKSDRRDGSFKIELDRDYGGGADRRGRLKKEGTPSFKSRSVLV